MRIPLSLWPGFSYPGTDVQVRLCEGKVFMDVRATFFVNLTRARFILEEGTSTEKTLPPGWWAKL